MPLLASTFEVMERLNKRLAQDLIPNLDRRTRTRYPLTLEVRHTADGPLKMGSGRSIDLSSSGLSFTTDTPLYFGQAVKAYIDWPTMLDGNVKLQLEVWGIVVRTEGRKVALQIQRHDFRTRRVGQRPA